MVAQAGISVREAEVLSLLGDHLSNAEIGARMFISVRTVETHVSSLLRKLNAPDRRALAQIAVEWSRAARGGKVASGLPSPVTTFIGRVPERAELAQTVKTSRQVTVVGPGGAGKTRLALAVATDIAPDFADGVWFVDLVPVTDPSMVGAAVAAAVGIGEQQGRGIDDSVIAALTDRHALLVLDNCEHLRDGVAPFAERLLAGCARLTVLATSRARLMVPFERVYSIPPLSTDGDAVALFLDRAAAVGSPVPEDQRDRAAQICRGLDGIALAIELAAARLPTLGLDGLADVLPDQLRLLTGGARADDRHRSVRAMLDWSHALLDPADRILLRRVAVFVGPFTTEAATQVAAFAPLAPAEVTDGLARLTEQSLLTVAPAATGTRYRALETIRQYGFEQLSASGERREVQSRHLRWCLTTAGQLSGVTRLDTGAWRARFDAIADDMRAALGWAVEEADRHDAYELALSLAELTFTRNLVGEAQQRYEQAALLATDMLAVASALRNAAAVAGCRSRGEDVLRLFREAAAAARASGDFAGVARDLATAAAAVYRFSGTFSEPPPPSEAAALLSAAREAAREAGTGDLTAQAAIALAECAVQSGQSKANAVALAERAVDLAHRSGDPLAESAALDALTAARCWAGDNFATAEAARRRVELLAPLPVTPASAYERANALSEAAETCLGVGDLTGARRWGQQLRDLPLLAERGDFATSRLIVADALVGNADDVLTASGRFLDAWQRAGSPHAPNLAMAPAAVAMIHGLRGDDDARALWLSVADDLGTHEEKAAHSTVFDAIVQLHRGRADLAMTALAVEPDEMDEWVIWVWRHWYLALRAEAAAITANPHAHQRIDAARSSVTGNPIAAAMLDRAAAIIDGDRDRILAVATAFEDAGCRYQWARTLVLAGAGDSALAEMGLTP